MRQEIIQDDEIQARIRREQEDPITMVIVVRKDSSQTALELARSVILAVRSADKLWGQTEAYRARMDGSFRKITLRAKQGQWTQLQDLDHVIHGDIIVLKPGPKSQRAAVIGKLQVFQHVKESDLDQAPAHVDGFFVKRDLGMSHGKIFAQLGHAAIMAREVGSDDDVDIQIAYLEGSWEAACEAFDVICVKDGGITEIAAGSETIMAVIAKA